MRTANTEENSPAWNPGLRIVQLDLARKMETPEFVKGYIDRVAAVGYDTLQLYLEARVATRTFALPAGERYTAEDMRGIVAHAASRGMMVVPVVSVADRTSRLVPKSVVGTRGLVRDAETILVDDYSAATFGHSGFLDAFRDNALRDAVSSITVNLTP